MNSLGECFPVEMVSLHHCICRCCHLRSNCQSKWHRLSHPDPRLATVGDSRRHQFAGVPTTFSLHSCHTKLHSVSYHFFVIWIVLI